MELIRQYFPDITDHQFQKLSTYRDLLLDWNTKINLISRKDTDKLVEFHILHSLSVAKLIQFQPFCHILDLGTGGGLPGIPLAILFPKTNFHLIDSIGKKITAVKHMIEELQIENASAEQIRAEQHHGDYDFVVTRAVAQSEKLVQWTKHLFKDYHEHELQNGIIALKGGDLYEELKPIKKQWKTHYLSAFFKEDFFETKQLLHIAMKR